MTTTFIALYLLLGIGVAVWWRIDKGSKMSLVTLTFITFGWGFGLFMWVMCAAMDFLDKLEV